MAWQARCTEALDLRPTSTASSVALSSSMVVYEILHLSKTSCIDLISFFVAGIACMFGVFDWLIISSPPGASPEFGKDPTRSSRDETVGVYDEIARSGSEVEGPSEGVSYIPATWIGKNASGPVAHHQIRNVLVDS